MSGSGRRWAACILCSVPPSCALLAALPAARLQLPGWGVEGGDWAEIDRLNEEELAAAGACRRHKQCRAAGGGVRQGARLEGALSCPSLPRLPAAWQLSLLPCLASLQLLPGYAPTARRGGAAGRGRCSGRQPHCI